MKIEILTLRLTGTTYTQSLGWDIGTYTNYTIERGSTDDIKQYFYGNVHSTDNDATAWAVLFRVGGNESGSEYAILTRPSVGDDILEYG